MIKWLGREAWLVVLPYNAIFIKTLSIPFVSCLSFHHCVFNVIVTDNKLKLYRQYNIYTTSQCTKSNAPQYHKTYFEFTFTNDAYDLHDFTAESSFLINVLLQYNNFVSSCTTSEANAIMLNRRNHNFIDKILPPGSGSS